MRFSCAHIKSDCYMKKVLLSFSLVLLVVICTVLNAEVVVRMEVQQGADADFVDIKLLENKAPLTVANFLNYVRNGDYIKSFIHRSDPGFIIQGGGFTFDSSINDGSFTYDSVNDLYPGGLQPVAGDVPIPNEFGRSNLRGTMAMAKIANDPDSATSQWFFNLADNSSILDNQNGGFTVFAEILNGMAFVDAIASQAIFDRTDIHFGFGELPLLNFIMDPVQEANLVYINKIQELFTISPNIDYGIVTSGANLQPEIVIKNTSNDELTIGGIADINQLVLPFRIVNDRCSNSILQPGSRCAFIVLFSPESSGIYTDTFNVEFIDLDVSYEITLVGEGGPSVPEADITLTSTSVDYGDVDVLYVNNYSYASGQIINNFGDLPLVISSISLEGPSVDEFSLTGGCLNVSSLNPGELCQLDIDFSPVTAGAKSATLTIISSDPDESPFLVPLFGNAIAENDGVSATEEDACLNGGDGNNDGILDSQQSNVASLVSMRGSYVTFLTSNGVRISEMSVSDQAKFEKLPDDIDLNSGVYKFDAGISQSGGIIEVGLMLPEDLGPKAFYLYGPTLENAIPHWSEFNFDGETGAQIIGKAVIQSPSGIAITRNLVTLKFKYGGRGDTDLTADGKISSAVGVSVNPVSGEGAVNIKFIVIFLVVLLFARSRWRGYVIMGIPHHC